MTTNDPRTEQLYRHFERFVHPVEGASSAVAAVLIHQDEAVFLPEPLDEAGRLSKAVRTSSKEGGIQKEAVKVAWVMLRYSRGIPHGYAGVTISAMETAEPPHKPDAQEIQEAIRRAVAGEVDLEPLTPRERELLHTALVEFNSQYWMQAPAELKRAFQ